MLFFRRPSLDALEQLLDQARAADVTYAEIGSTLADDRPRAYRHDFDETFLGNGRGVFDTAVSALRRWQAHIGAGIEVLPRGATVDEGETTLLLISAAGVWTVAPCRVVYVVEEPDLFRFAYGTLPGHPEQGEASFAISHRVEDEVFFRVASFSRPVDPIARLAKPFRRRIQRRAPLSQRAQRRCDVVSGTGRPLLAEHLRALRPCSAESWRSSDDPRRARNGSTLDRLSGDAEPASPLSLLRRRTRPA